MSRLIHIIAAFALVLAFVWDSAGSGCLDGLHRWHRAQQEAYQSGIAADTLLLLQSDYEALTVRDKREIRFQGRMYDIHSVTGNGDRVVLAGHFDDFDNELFKILDSLLHEGPDAPNDDQGLCMFLFTGTIPRPLLLRVPVLPGGHSKYFLGGIDAVSSETLDVLTAPPDTPVPLSVYFQSFI